MKTSTSRAESGFAYSRSFFENLVDTALSHAKKLGATYAGAEASEGCGLSVWASSLRISLPMNCI